MMAALDLYDCPSRQDEIGFDSSGWANPVPAIVQRVERPSDDPSNFLDRYGVYSWLVEVTLQEENTKARTKRFTSEDGAVVEIEPGGDAAEEYYALPELLEGVKERLGVGVKHLGKALGVERPTIYAWLKGEQQPQPKRWARIRALVELADYWEGMCSQPLSRKIFVPVASGKSAMDLLSADQLNVPEIKELLQRLATDEMEHSARLKSKGVTMRERMKKKGVKPLPEEVVDQTLRDFSKR